jgi:hypothetical protein
MDPVRAAKDHRNRLDRLRRKARAGGYSLNRISCGRNVVYLLFRERDNRIVKAHLSGDYPADPATHGEMAVVEGWFA